MGLTKRYMETIAEQGWQSPDTFVCADCLDNRFLRTEIEQAESNRLSCSYCASNHAVPISVILRPIGKTVKKYFREPSSAGVPRDDGDWIDLLTDIDDVLFALDLRCNDLLFRHIAGAFINTEFVECNGHWGNEQKSDRLIAHWEYFEETVKHKTRYFLREDNINSEFNPFMEFPNLTSFLRSIGAAAESLKLLSILPPQDIFYRARHMKNGDVLSKFEDLGPPPNNIATAGRMNPTGISYFYLANTQETALGEIVSRPPSNVTVGRFQLKREIIVLDLTSLPKLPSIFDLNQYETRHSILFLHEFGKRISASVIKDGRERLEYAPSQVVSEFFAQVFVSTEFEKGIDGMIYRSSVVPSGKNLVLFPSMDGSGWEDLCDLISRQPLAIRDWEQLFDLIS